MSIEKLADLSAKLKTSTKEINSFVMKDEFIKIVFDDKVLRLALSGNKSTCSGYLFEYIKNLIEDKSDELIAEAKAKLLKDYYNDVNEVRMESIMFATGLEFNLKDIDKL